MKITGLETFLLKIPFSGAAEAEIAAGAADAMNVLLLRVDTENGPSGWGEAFGHGISPATQTALETLIRPMLVGREAGDITGIFRDLQQATHVFGRSGAARYAVSGVDIALWDIAGKVAGLPLHRLLGGPASPCAPPPSPAPRSTGSCSRPSARHRGRPRHGPRASGPV